MPAAVPQATRAMFMRAPAQSQRARLADLRAGMKMYVGPAPGLRDGDASGFSRLPVSNDAPPRMIDN